MENAKLLDAIKSRRSTRTFTGEEISKADWQTLMLSLKDLSKRHDVRLSLLKNEYQGKQFGTYGIIKRPAAYLSCICKKEKSSLLKAGQALEAAVLLCEELGLGSCWLGGSFNRRDFGNALSVKSGEVIPCVIAIGKSAEKERLLGVVMRLGVKSHTRQPFGTLFFNGAFDKPFEKDDSPISTAFEMVRLAPSASNRQPWRLIKAVDIVHFYLQHAPGGEKMAYDIQLVDIGIAMNHFEQTMKALGQAGRFAKDDPGIAPLPEQCEYITSWRWS